MFFNNGQTRKCYPNFTIHPSTGVYERVGHSPLYYEILMLHAYVFNIPVAYHRRAVLTP